MDNEEVQDYNPFFLHKDEHDAETAENYDPFSLTEGDSSKQIDEDYDPFSLHRDEASEEQTEEKDITQKEEREEICENVDSQSTVLVHKEGEYQEEANTELNEHDAEPEECQLEDREEMIEPDPEEYEQDLEPLYDPDEIDFIRDMEELGRILREAEEEQGVSEEELDRYENIGFEAEQYFRKLKERGQDIGKEEEIQKTNEDEEGLEKEPIEEIKQVPSDNEPEEEPEDYPKEVETEHEAEYFMNGEEDLHEKGMSSEEIAKEMQQTEASYELNEQVETLYEQQEKEKLKSIDHEGEEEGDEIEEIDRIDVIEHAVDKEAEFQSQGMPQEEIDQEIESSITEFYQKEQEENQQKEQEKEIKKDVILENESSNGQKNKNATEPHLKNENLQEIHEIALESDDNKELSKEEELKTLKDVEKSKKAEFNIDEREELQQLYREETGKRPIYAGETTKGFRQWLEQHQIKKEQVNEQKEKEKIKEKWKKILREWIKESKEELLNSELKLMLTELLQNAEALEDLYKKCAHKETTEKSRNQWKTLLYMLQMKYPIHLELYRNIRELKIFVQESHPWDIPQIRNKFLQHLTEKYRILKKNLKVLSELPVENNTNPKQKETIQMLKVSSNYARIKYYWPSIVKFLIMRFSENPWEITISKNEKTQIIFEIFTQLKLIDNKNFSDQTRFHKLDENFLEKIIITTPYILLKEYNHLDCVNDLYRIVYKTSGKPQPRFRRIVRLFNAGKFRIASYSNEQFFQALQDHMEKFLELLKLSKEINELGIVINNAFKQKVMNFFKRLVLSGDHLNIYNSLERDYKDPRYITAGFIYISFQIYNDLENLDRTGLTYTKYANILNLNRNKLNLYIKKLFKNYIEINEKEYIKKIEHYFNHFISTLGKSSKVNLNFSLKFKQKLNKKVIDLYEYIKANELIIPKNYENRLKNSNSSVNKQVLRIIKILKGRCFDINELTKNYEYFNFFPQYLAAILMYFFKDLNEFRAEDKQGKFMTILSFKLFHDVLRISRKNLLRLFKLFKYTVEPYLGYRLANRKVYDEEFIKFLKNNKNKKENHLILTLIESYGKNASYFLKKIKLFESSISIAIKLLKDENYNLRNNSLEKIKNFILDLKKNGNLNWKSAFLEYENYLKFLETQYGKGLKFFKWSKQIFNWNEKRVEVEKKLSLKNLLYKLFNKIESGNYPEEIFNNVNPRCSKFIIKGSKDFPLFKKELEIYEKMLFEKGIIKIKENSEIGCLLSNFVLEANEFYKKYFHKFYSKSGNLRHAPLLNYIFINCKKALAKEVLVWINIAVPKSKFSYLTGHIDLLLSDGSTLYIADYKPESEKDKSLLISIPQVASYGTIFKSLIPNYSIKCISFNENNAWEFDPSILLNSFSEVVTELQKSHPNLNPKWEIILNNIVAKK